jgi:hypothetical protein
MTINITNTLIRLSRPPYPAVFLATGPDGTTWTYDGPRGCETEEENCFRALVALAFAGRGGDCREINAGDSYIHLRH